MTIPEPTSQLSVVIPAYNESQNLEQVVQDCAKFLDSHVEDWEILIVNDGSTDDTGFIAKELHTQNKQIKVIHHEKNRGMSAALKTGFIKANLSHITLLPADGQIAPAELKTLLKSIQGHDLVLSYYKKRPDSLFRILLSRTSRLIIFCILGLTEKLQGPYIFKQSLLNRVTLRSSRSAGFIAFELIYKAKRLGLKTTSVQIECLPRLSGESKVTNFKTIFMTFYELLRIRFEQKIN
jgi:glycosyltransferase involved in cell wall biosynthesis